MRPTSGGFYNSAKIDFHVSDFQCTSLADGLPLQGYHWPVASPLAVISLVHGFGEHCGRYEELATYLAAQRIAVVGVDLRGHGRTNSPRGFAASYQHLHDDLKTLLQETSKRYPRAPHFLFGHSMGGGLVLHHRANAGASEPLMGYLVSAPLIQTTRPVSSLLRAAVKTLSFVFPKMTMPIGVSGTKISTIPMEQDRYDHDPLNHNRLGVRLAVGMIEAGERLLEDDVAATGNRPLVVWHSKSDQINSYEAAQQFAAKASRCQFVSFADARHELHHDMTRESVHELMARFIISRAASSQKET